MSYVIRSKILLVIDCWKHILLIYVNNIIHIWSYNNEKEGRASVSIWLKFMYFDILLSILVRDWKWNGNTYLEFIPWIKDYLVFPQSKMLVCPFLPSLIIPIMPKIVAPQAQLTHPNIVFVHNWCFISLNDPNQPEIDLTSYCTLLSIDKDGHWNQ